jgi:excisionase family DNA binding protein
MTREEAAQALGISVRSLQRTVKRGALQVKYKRGVSGKMEAVFDPEAVSRYKEEMSREIVPEAPATMSDTALARVGAPQVAGALLQWLEATQRDSRPHTLSVPVESKPLLKLDEASALTGLSRRVLRDAIDAGKLKAKMVGRAWRVKRTDLDLFISKL